MKSLDNHISERLRRLLAFRGESIRQFSTRSGVPYKTLQDYLAGKAMPGAKHLSKFAAIGVDLNWLLAGKLRAHLPALPAEETKAEDVAAIGSNIDLLEALQEAAVSDAEGYAKRLFERRGTPINLRHAVVAIDYYLQIRLHAASGVATHMKKLRRSGLTIEDIADMCTLPNLADLDSHVDQLAPEHAVIARGDQ